MGSLWACKGLEREGDARLVNGEMIFSHHQINPHIFLGGAPERGHYGGGAWYSNYIVHVSFPVYRTRMQSSAQPGLSNQPA